MAQLRLRIGASVDASVATAFTQLEKAAQRAAATIQRQLGAMGVDATRKLAAEASKAAGPYRQTGEAAASAASKIGKANAETIASMGNLASGVKQRFNALHNDLIKLPVDLRVVAQEAQKALAATERARARQTLGLGSSSTSVGHGGGGGGGGRNSIYWHPASWLTVRKPNIRTLDIDPIGGAGRFGMSAASYLGQAVTGLARASGVETDWTALAARNVNDEKLAQQISNSGYMPGQSGPNGQIVNRQALLAESRQTAMNTGMSRGDILEGMQAFVGKTGDLNLARQTMEDMAKLSRATGTSFADMANSGAEVANVLGDIPDKGKVVQSIMQQIAGQGKLGAVEVRDLATQMAKIATQATKFKGGAAENIALLGVVAQEAKGRGGATNAAQATTAVGRFVEEFAKPTVLKKMAGAGLNPYADAGHTQLKQAPEIIKDILAYTKGDLSKLGGVMPSTIAQKAIGGFAQVYNQAGGGKAGLAAVTEEFQRLQSAQLTTEEVTRSFGASMETSEAKAHVFNEKMADVVEKMQGSLVPALTALAPAVLTAATAASTFAQNLVGGGKPGEDGIAGTIGRAFRTAFGDESVKSNKEQAAEEHAKERLKAGNDYNNILAWRDTHLIMNAEGAATPEFVGKQFAAAKPILDQLGEDDAHLRMQAGDLRGKVEDEGKRVRGILGGDATDEDIQKFIKEDKGVRGHDVATRYLQDKQQLQSITDQMGKIEALEAQLKSVISGGAVTVRIDPSGAPAPAPGGKTPPDAPTPK
jgi:Phage-related minor tail protein